MRSVINVLATIVIGTILGVVLIYCFEKTPTGIKEIDSLYLWYGLPSLLVLVHAGYSFGGIPMFNQPRGHFDFWKNCIIWLLCLFPIVVTLGLNWPPQIVHDFYWITLAIVASFHICIWQYLRNMKSYPRKSLWVFCR